MLPLLLLLLLSLMDERFEDWFAKVCAADDAATALSNSIIIVRNSSENMKTFHNGKIVSEGVAIPRTKHTWHMYIYLIFLFSVVF